MEVSIDTENTITLFDSKFTATKHFFSTFTIISYAFSPVMNKTSRDH